MKGLNKQSKAIVVFKETMYIIQTIFNCKLPILGKEDCELFDVSKK